MIPSNLGRWGNASPITQSSGLARDPNNTSFWTHNDQGNPTTDLYKILPATGNQAVTIQKQVAVQNVQNLDWEDLAKDHSGNIYLCQIGKNCNANSDPEECPTRYIFKIHKLALATLNHPDSTTVTPETYYFRYPLTGYDLENCDTDDTVFVNSEAAVWMDDAVYVFTKSIWSKYTNNCGGWVNGYTYYFKIPLITGSTMEDPIVGIYKGKVNLKVRPQDATNDYQVTAAALSEDEKVLSLTTYDRIWQFRNFEDDQFFEGTSLYNEYSTNGSDTITRGYEGIEFMSDRAVLLGVDGVNGRLSGINLDSLAGWVRNTNDDGPGSLRHVIASVSEGDTVRFLHALNDDTIHISTPLMIERDMHFKPILNDHITIAAQNTSTLLVPVDKLVSLQHMTLIGGSFEEPCISNQGILVIDGDCVIRNE